MKPEISIVIPAYNEAIRLGESLRTILNYLDSKNRNAEIIVVDDGSKDETALTAERIFAEYTGKTSVRVISYSENRGKGYAVRIGLSAAAGVISLFSDADLSTPVSEMEKIIAPIVNEKADICIGSRALDRNLIGTHQSWIREQGGRIFNLVVRAATKLPFADTQCGFKAFRTNLIQPIVKAGRVDRFGFDVEILLIAFAAKLRIEEIPVRWNHSEGSKVNFRNDSWRMFKEVLSIKNNRRRGFYQPAISEIEQLTAQFSNTEIPVKRRFSPKTKKVKKYAYQTARKTSRIWKSAKN